MPSQHKRTTAQRGYDAQHAALRRQLDITVQAGNGYCTEPECLMPNRWIPPDTPWDLAHNRNTGGYHGPAHPKCNRTEGALHQNTSKPEQPAWHSRQW